MISKRCSFAFIFIAACACHAWAAPGNVYKCGSSYSQSPCAGAKLVDVDDARDPQQKKHKDEITARDAELARDMEKDRLAQEKALRAAEAKRPVVTAPPQVVVVQEDPHPVKAKHFKHKTMKQLGFVAEVPDSKRTPAKKKAAAKTETQAQP
jgi:hypothetical protein